MRTMEREIADLMREERDLFLPTPLYICSWKRCVPDMLSFQSGGYVLQHIFAGVHHRHYTTPGTFHMAIIVTYSNY